MTKGLLAFVAALILLVTMCARCGRPEAPNPLRATGQAGHQAGRDRTRKGKPKGTLTIAQHFGLDPGWLDPLEHIYALTS